MQEDECDEEDVIREEEERERQEREVVDGRWERKKDERWRSATGRQNLLDRREALQMWNETRRYCDREKSTRRSTQRYLFR